MENNRILVVAGPTAAGKTEYAIEFANEFNGEIVSCDSMQLYKYMDIGSAKPTEEERRRAVHHLVDFLDPREEFSVAGYQQLATDAINDILARGRLPIISGGTGLYLNSLLFEMDFAGAPKDEQFRKELEKIALNEGGETLHKMLEKKDPEAAERIHPNNVKKIIRALESLKEGEENVRPFNEISKPNNAWNPLLICLHRNREELYDRINLRVDKLVEAGLVDEVRSLLGMGLTYDDISMKGIGYKEIIEYTEGLCSLEEAIENTKKNTRHYAKRQLTWFRKYDTMKWINLSEYLSEQEAKEDIKEWLRKRL